MSVEQKVRGHFHADAARFDAIYEQDKGPVTRFIDHVWRGVVRRRLDLALEKLAPFEGRTYLDVGTGSGRFCHAYAQHGAAQINENETSVAVAVATDVEAPQLQQRRLLELGRYVRVAIRHELDPPANDRPMGGAEAVDGPFGRRFPPGSGRRRGRQFCHAARRVV